MAKAKARKGPAGMAQIHLRARISYLNSVATVLQDTVSKKLEPTAETSQDSHHKLPPSLIGRTGASNIARQYSSQARAVSLKSQARVPRDMKRSICKRCDARLVSGTSCTDEIENKSRGGKKPWADVRVVKCGTCGTVKRFPQGKKRSMKLVERKKDSKHGASEEARAAET